LKNSIDHHCEKCGNSDLTIEEVAGDKNYIAKFLRKNKSPPKNNSHIEKDTTLTTNSDTICLCPNNEKKVS
jgi:hypothetical protein